MSADKIEGSCSVREALREPGQRDGIAMSVATAFVERDFASDE